MGVSLNDLICQAEIEGDPCKDVFMYIGANMEVTLTCGETALFSAVVNGDVDSVIPLLNYVDVNNVSNYRCSALMVAAATNALGGIQVPEAPAHRGSSCEQNQCE